MFDVDHSFRGALSKDCDMWKGFDGHHVPRGVQWHKPRGIALERHGPLARRHANP